MHAGEDTLERTVCEIELEIKNADGLHMRPAMQFVDVANQFDCDLCESLLKKSTSMNQCQIIDYC